MLLMVKESDISVTNVSVFPNRELISKIANAIAKTIAYIIT
jgi:hypothetical protein